MTGLAALVANPGAQTMPYFDPAFPDRRLVLHSACPSGFGPATPVLFVHHGVARNGQAYRDYWLEHVDSCGILAIAIEFPEESFPEYLWYNFGNLHAKDGTPNPRSDWTFGIDDRLFSALQAEDVVESQRYGVFGHSAGGQYVHRMLSFGYRDRVAVAVSANAGTYAMPDLDIPWPFGLGDVGLTPAALQAVLEFPIAIMAGTEDTRTTGKFFPKGPRSLRQGPHRHARAHTYIRMGHDAAAALGTTCRWAVIDVPGVGHSGRGMSAAAAPVVAAALHAAQTG